MIGMNEREKVAHVLRRFGLGAGKVEVDAYLPLGVDGALAKLIDYEKTDEGFPVNPYEFCADPNGMLYFDPFRFTSWWALRMLLTKRPVQERLTLFWHDHFAVSGAKVFDGPSMLSYQQTLRKHANGNFGSLLKDVCKEPAMIFYLDIHTSEKGKPNENFGRELLELFTVGHGRYTEKDIKETARTFTGWMLHYAGLGDETPYEKIVERMAKEGRSVYSFCRVPSLHDESEKTVLGKSARFEGDDLLEMLAKRPETAEHLGGKLWEWFAYEKPEAAVKNRLGKVFLDSGGEIKPVLREIARSNEFWSERCVRNRPKNPVDFSAALFRQLGLRDVILSLRGERKELFAPMRPEVKGAGDGLAFLMNQQGLLLLYPPSVGGWEWGQAWITSANVTNRIKHADILFRGDDQNRPIAVYLAGLILNQYKATDSAGVVAALTQIFDAENIPAEKAASLTKVCEEKGGVNALRDKEKASILLSEVAKLMFATPEFQLC